MDKTENSENKCILSVKDLSVEYTSGKDIVRAVNGVSFQLNYGQTLGLVGETGAGKTTIAKSILRLLPVPPARMTGGEIYLDGKKLEIKTPKDAINNGIVMVTEDRRKYGVVLMRSIQENISLPNMDDFCNYGFLIDHKKEKEKCQEIFDELRIKAPSMETVAGNLSGGNQQKVVLGKWLLSTPKVLILDEPTRGIDVGAKFEIYQLMSEIASRGIAILFISSELPEILGMCDNVLVMCEGDAKAELSRDMMTQERIMSKELSNIREVRSRGADVALFIKADLIQSSTREFDTFVLPNLPDELMVFPASVALQLLAYYVSSDKGFDVDKPRNLAKVVTVE